MMERRIGIWAAILFLVIAGRGCSGGRTAGPTSYAGKAYLQALGKLVVSDFRKAIEGYWLPDSHLSYMISLGTIKLARVYIRKIDFPQDLPKFNNGVLKDEMKQANARVLFSSNECLLVKATQGSHAPHSTFLYQLILNGDAESPKVKQAFILGGQKRKVSQHKDIFDQLKRTIEIPRGVKLSDILTDFPLLVLQVLNEEECVANHGMIPKEIVNLMYEGDFLFLFGDYYELTVTSSFEGDEHIQFTGNIWRTSGERIYTFLMAAIVVEDGGFDKRLQSIHIIVKKVTKDPGKTADNQLSAGTRHSAEAMQIDESP